MKNRSLLGEFYGTFLLVFFGLSAVGSAAILGTDLGLFQVAAIWGLGLMVAIYVSADASGAHLNPAITLAFASWTAFSWKQVPIYLVGQFMGSGLAALVVYVLFGSAITQYEIDMGLIRGEEGSERSAMVFGEYYPNPGSAADGGSMSSQGWAIAFGAEMVGTALLAFVIFCLVGAKREKMPGWLVPILIGITLMVLISIFAPISMAGFNPARDFAPRLVSAFLGWGAYSFSYNGHGWFTVYILAPFVGAQLGAIAHKLLVKKSLE